MHNAQVDRATPARLRCVFMSLGRPEMIVHLALCIVHYTLSVVP